MLQSPCYTLPVLRTRPPQVYPWWCRTTLYPRPVQVYLWWGQGYVILPFSIQGVVVRVLAAPGGTCGGEGAGYTRRQVCARQPVWEWWPQGIRESGVYCTVCVLNGALQPGPVAPLACTSTQEASSRACQREIPKQLHRQV